MRTDPPVRWFRPVAIASARHRQSQPASHFPQSRRLRVSSPRIFRFYRTQPQAGERAELFLREIRRRMGQARNTPGCPHQPHCLLDRQQPFRQHLPRKRTEDAAKRLVAAPGEPASDEQPRDVPPAEARRGFRNQSHAIMRAGERRLCQLGDEVVEPLAPALAESRQGGVQFRVIGADEVPQQMHFPPGKTCRDLDGGNHLDLVAGRGSRSIHCGKGVVIRDRHRGQIGLSGEGDDLR